MTPTNKAESMGEVKLTEPRKRVLRKLVARGGRATDYDLAYPRSHMMHALYMAKLIDIGGHRNAWGDPDALAGWWEITPTGRALLKENGDG